MAYRAFFDDKREFGIELEGFGFSRLEIVEALEQERIPTSLGDSYSAGVQKWTIGFDSTIKQLYPVEIISPILSGEKGFHQVKKVCAVLNRMGFQTDQSCGFHIHWSVADYTGRSVINLLRLYGKYEKVLDFLFDESRRGDESDFAHSLIKEGGIGWTYILDKPFFYQAYQIAKEFEDTQRTKNKTSFPSARHHKVNVCAINKYRTIEFRQHQGTFDYEEIKNWLVLSQQLINRAKDSLVLEGISTWESMNKTLGLTESQLRESMETGDKFLLRDMRDFYRKIYRENKEKEKVYASHMG